jgi:hypothetical protein
MIIDTNTEKLAILSIGNESVKLKKIIFAILFLAYNCKTELKLQEPKNDKLCLKH